MIICLREPIGADFGCLPCNSPSQLSPLILAELQTLLCFFQDYCSKYPDVERQLTAVSKDFAKLLLPAAWEQGKK